MRGRSPSYFFGGIMDIIKKWFLRIDIEREFDTPIIELYMQDVKTNLFITTLTNNGARIALKDYNIVTLNVLKADDTRLMVSGKVTEDGNVTFEMDSQATSVKGICSATIRIYEGDSSVTSKPFYFSVIDDPYRGTDNSIISQNSYTALQNILSQTAKALEEAVKVNDYFKVNLPTVKELISYEPILRDIVKNKDEAKELIRESKNLQVKIDASMADLKRLEGLIPEVNRLVDKGNETIRALTNATENVSETIARAETKRADLEGILSMFKDIDEKAQRIKAMSDEVNSLLPKLDEAKSVKSGLDSSVASAKLNKASLDASLESAGDIDRDLGNKINQSKTLSNNLKADIENAKNTNSTLNSDREAASLIVTELKNTKNDADVVNSQLNSSQIKASSTKDELDKLVTDANKTTNEAKSINTALKETNSKAEANKASLESANTKASNLASDLSSKTSLAEGASTKLKTNTDLANKASENLETNKSLADSSLSKLKEEIGKSENLEASLREIIASGDLSKYVTDPKLEEALKKYATKEDLSGVDVTSHLADYAKKIDLNKKVDKVTGKGLSTNDFNDSYKAKVDAIPDDPKYTDTTYDLSGYATKEDLSSIDVTGQLVDYAKKTDLNNKVDKVSGKTLSTNDYTNADKAKVDAIPPNPKYTDTTYDLSGYAKKTEIKTKLSEMTGDSTHRTVTDSEKATWNTVSNKVDKVAGKQLSTNDFSNSHKSKVDAIPSNPKYTDTVTTINGKTGAISKADITALGIPGTNTTYPVATQSKNGLLSAADKKRLDNIKEQVALTEAQYNALSSTQKNDSKKIYFIKA